MKFECLEDKDINKILLHYSIGECKKVDHIWWAFGNYVYVIKTSRGKYVVKIFKADKKFVNFQLRLMGRASRAGLPIPEIIKTKQKKDLMMIKNHPLLIQRFVEGKPARDLNKKEIESCAYTLIDLVKALRGVRKTGAYTWGGDYQFDKSRFFYKTKKIFGLNIGKEIESYFSEVKKFDKRKLRKSIVHGDFHTINLLLHKGAVVAIIDWDDAHEDFELQEIANFMCHSFYLGNDFDTRKMKLFLRFLESRYPLTDMDKRVLYYFMKLRLINSLCWVYRHAQNQKGKKRQVCLRNVRRDIRRYRNFCKIKLDEFYD